MSRPSGSTDDFRRRKNRPPAERIAQAGTLHQVDLAAEEVLQVLTQFDQFEQAVVGLRSERYEHVDVAVGSEVASRTEPKSASSATP